eukprot:3229096-Amphidinium_carterae.1
MFQSPRIPKTIKITQNWSGFSKTFKLVGDLRALGVVAALRGQRRNVDRHDDLLHSIGCNGAFGWRPQW